MALVSLVVSKEGLHPHHEYWRGPRTFQLRVSSPSLTQHLYYLKFVLHCQVFSLGLYGFSSNRIQTLTGVPTLTQCQFPLSSYIYIISHLGQRVKSFLHFISFSFIFLRGFLEVLRGTSLTHQTQHTYYTNTKRKCQVFSSLFLWYGDCMEGWVCKKRTKNLVQFLHSSEGL